MIRRNLVFVIMAVAALVMYAQEDVMKKNGKQYVVNSSTLTDVRGFKGKTPIEVHIEKGKVVEIVALRNAETPRFFDIIRSKLLPMYNKLTVKEAKKLSEKAKPDAVTGATYSANAVQKNINAALLYYEKNK